MPLKDFIFIHFRSFMSWHFFPVLFGRLTKNCHDFWRRKGQTEPRRFYLQQPVVALAPLFFADPVGEFPERPELLSVREFLHGEFC